MNMRTVRIMLIMRGGNDTLQMMKQTESATTKVNMVYPNTLLGRIDVFWHKHQFKNRTVAVLWLIKAALDAKLAPKGE